jgi:nitrate reductase gamma subunit
MPLVQLLLYAAAAFCVAATIVRAARHARQPVHLRWELYPIAHERGRAAHGGSGFEEPEHWDRARRPDRAAALRAILAEVFLLAGVRRHNRPLWRFSLPFHHGVYLVAAWLVLVATTGARWPAGDPPPLFAGAVAALGFFGLGLGLAGTIGLLHRRLSDPALRAYSAPADLANLVLWLLYLGWTAGTHAAEGGFASLLRFAGAWVRGREADPGPALTVEVALGAVLLAYLPLSRMFHAVAKYFLYHEVRWDDAPNPRGGALERRLVRAMDFGLGWSAPHAAAARSWGEAAAAPDRPETP